MASILCEHCAAACCRYLAIEIDKPTTARDHDDIRWYILHEGISVFVEDGDWYIQIQTKCKQLGPDNLCMVYTTRPDICRDYEAGDCDYSETPYGYDHFFTHAKQIEEYYEKKTGRKLAPGSTPPQPRKRKKRAKKSG